MNRVLAVLFCCFPILFQGCGGGADGRKPVYPVSGTIKFHGTPVIGAIVSFTPTAGQPAALGRTDDQGKYTLTTYETDDGAAKGRFSVLVMKFDTGGAAGGNPEAEHSTDVNAPDASSHDAGGGGDADSSELLPPIYGDASTTTLSAEVKDSGENTFDFDLQ